MKTPDLDNLIIKALDGDKKASTEIIKEIGMLQEFDRGLAGCHGGKLPEPNHKKIIEILIGVVAHGQ